MFDFRCLIFDVKKGSRLRCAPRKSAIPHPTSHIRAYGLTLIELLVVIVILTTLVAGVIPILSPNNDTRKIREATRMLQTYIMQAQAEAARTGRPQGIAFQESSIGTGVALDVFRLEVPRPFAGFSSASSARIIREERPVDSNNFIYYIQFLLADTATRIAPIAFPPVGDYDRDAIPPKLIRYHDEINIAGKLYRVIDRDLNGNGMPIPNNEPMPDDDYYSVLGANNHNEWTFLCEEVNADGQTLAFVQDFPSGGNTHSLTAPKPYKFVRQPTNTSEQPMQFPASIGIDMQGSVVEGSSTGGFPTDGSLFITGKQNTVGIMFSPTGGVSDVLFNGNSLNNASRIALLMGRVENGGIVPELNSSGSQIVGGPWEVQNDPQDDQLAAHVELEKLQQDINWLNLDSRWMSIVVSSGRAVVSENAFVNAGDYVDDDVADQVAQQIEAAHGFAHEMRTAGAGR